MYFRKTNAEPRNNAVELPTAALHFSGFGPKEPAEYYALSDAVVVLKQDMTTPELFRAFLSLLTLAQQLTNELILSVADCEGDCEDCPYEDLVFPVEIGLTENLRQNAGLPENAALFVCEEEDADPEEVREDTPRRELPQDMLTAFVEAGFCPAILEKSFLVGAVNYAG